MADYKPDYKTKLTELYSTYEGRTPGETELAGWKAFENDLPGLESKFREATKMTIDKNPLKNPYSDLNAFGYTEKPVDWESEIRRQYAEKMPEIESQIKSAAAGGGLDTGGYMTSLAKAKTASWSDMLANIMQAKQSQQQFDWSKQLPMIQRQWDKEDWTKNKNLALELADLSKPTDWEKFLSIINAGANVADALIPG